MAILEIQADGIVAIDKTTLVDQKLRERQDLQRLLKTSINAVADDLLIVAEEYGQWEDSRRRIDLLALDRDANIVVIELKRTDDGGHMELQALRYAAMTSVMTFDQVVAAHQNYLTRTGADGDARESILEFLQWDEPDEEIFAQDVRIVLVSMDFSREVTTTVLWLNQKGLDIRCVRLTPYRLQDRLLLDVQQIIPLPEAAEYQMRVREKERGGTSGRSGRDFTRFALQINGTALPALPKRHSVLQLFRHLASAGLAPDVVAAQFGNRKPERTMRRYTAEATTESIRRDLEQHGPRHPRRWFHGAEDLIRFGDSIYIVSTQWGIHTERFLRQVASAFPEHRIEIEAVARDQ